MDTKTTVPSPLLHSISSGKDLKQAKRTSFQSSKFFFTKILFSVFQSSRMSSYLCTKVFQNGGLFNVHSTSIFEILYQKRGLLNVNPTRLFEIPCIQRSISTTSPNLNSFTVSYLMNSCGLSQQKAIFISQRLQLENPSKPDSVLTLLRNHGFDDTLISKFVLKRPLLLLSDTDKTLKPKFDFFKSIGFSSPDLAKILSRDPIILTRSLEKQIIPVVAYFKSIVSTNANVIKMIKHSTWVINEDPQKHIVPNIALLRAHDVPEANIKWLLTHCPRAFLRSVSQFNEVFEAVKEMGFDTMKTTFVIGISGVVSMSKSFWEEKLKVYRKCGWSEEEIRKALVKQPNCMMVSKEKIMRIMDFFVSKMGYDSSLLAKHPSILLLSLEKRIIPRCSVCSVLAWNGLIKKDYNLRTLLGLSEKKFLKNHVSKFEKEVPGLLNVYQGKVNGLELSSR